MIARLLNWWRSRRRKTQLAKAPKTLDEAVDRLVAQMTEMDKDRYVKEDPTCPGVRFHFSGGMAMRNEWGLWGEESSLGQWFADHGIMHGDDRSACVYKALYCRLCGESFDIADEAAYYREYWAKMAKVQNGASFGVKLHKDGRVEIQLDKEGA